MTQKGRERKPGDRIPLSDSLEVLWGMGGGLSGGTT